MNNMKDEFYWGGSASSFQSEGAWNIDGKGMSVYDVKPIVNNGSDWKHANDFYHRYKEDIDLMAEMGFNMYRIQISWSRVFPSGRGNLNKKGIDFYDRVIDYMLHKGIKPMICLYHFDMPLNLAEKYNGFASREVIECFVDYANFIVNHFKGRVKHYITFNEQNLFMWKEKVFGGKIPKASNPQELLFQTAHHAFVTHARCVKLIKAIDPTIKVGGMISYNIIYPATPHPKDVKFARDFEYLYNLATLDVLMTGNYSPFLLSYLKKQGYELCITKEDLEVST